MAFDPVDALWGRILKLLGQALFAAGVVAMTFGWISAEESAVRMRTVVEGIIRSALSPVVSRVVGDAIRNRSWRCHLEAPSEDDGYPDFAYQTVAVSALLPDCPSSLRFLCIAQQSPDWRAYSDSSYQFRWEVEEDLDPRDPEVFRVDELRIDGVRHEVTPRQSKDGACEYVCSTPRDQRGREAQVSFVVTVRKFIGANDRLHIATKVFRDVQGAEFSLSVGESMCVAEISVGTDGITPLSGGELTYDTRRITAPDSSPVEVALRISEAIQRDSQVTFAVRRR
ncbi:hypothetical protein [Candidatus Poriferisodalis sp.]|uniref:hypothetical protein n=1 Tax=Candidatus Poriferisodalis sp. TaxID=3101277 RepID=UPI003B5AEA4D